MAPAQDIEMGDVDSLTVGEGEYRPYIREMAPSSPQTMPPCKVTRSKGDEIHTDFTIDIRSHPLSSSLKLQENNAPVLGSSSPQAMDVCRDSAVSGRSQLKHNDARLLQNDICKGLARAQQHRPRDQKDETVNANNYNTYMRIAESKEVTAPAARKGPKQMEETAPPPIMELQENPAKLTQPPHNKFAPAQPVKREIKLPSISSILQNVENKLTVSGAEGIPVQVIESALAHATKLQANPNYRPENNIVFLDDEDHRSNYIENPNNRRDSVFKDTRHYPQDYYSDEPVPEPYVSENQRAVYAKASKEREKDDLNAIHRKYSRVDSPGLEWTDLRQFPALKYFFRSGAFTGKSLDEVPEWYREELMCGGENWLVKKDIALWTEMKRKRYTVWKAQDVFDSANPPTLAIRSPTPASATIPAVEPLHPTQSTEVVSFDRHGKITLPSLPRHSGKKTRLPNAHMPFWRNQRDDTRPHEDLGEKHIDLDTIRIATNGPAAEFTDSAGGVNMNRDREVLDVMWAAKRMGGWYEKREVTEWPRKE